MLVLLRKRLARRGAEVTLFDVQPHVRRVLEITGLNRAFQFASASAGGGRRDLRRRNSAGMNRITI